MDGLGTSNFASRIRDTKSGFVRRALSLPVGYNAHGGRSRAARRICGGMSRRVRSSSGPAFSRICERELVCRRGGWKGFSRSVALLVSNSRASRKHTRQLLVCHRKSRSSSQGLEGWCDSWVRAWRLTHMPVPLEVSPCARRDRGGRRRRGCRFPPNVGGEFDWLSSSLLAWRRRARDSPRGVCGDIAARGLLGWILPGERRGHAWMKRVLTMTEGDWASRRSPFGR
ncbi:hypothetical protein OF83DRAFT_721578 [Amylostereum chailletii]|nr:hypothetical protein OF83DRAFT_721578 [Amylostereum chailletii]